MEKELEMYCKSHKMDFEKASPDELHDFFGTIDYYGALYSRDFDTFLDFKVNEHAIVCEYDEKVKSLSNLKRVIVELSEGKGIELYKRDGHFIIGKGNIKKDFCSNIVSPCDYSDTASCIGES